MSSNDTQLWAGFAEHHKLTEKQCDQFKQYYKLMVAANEKFNLTTIVELRPVINYHFSDSLALSNFVDMTKLSMIADVGTGAGFPGIPLKIKYPELSVILIEVTLKKVQFLEMVIQELGLENIEVCTLDWRTFLRNTDYPIELFCARASLQPEELVRVFKSVSPYKNAQLVYWAAEDWLPGDKEKPYLIKEQQYQIKHKIRKLVFFQNITIS